MELLFPELQERVCAQDCKLLIKTFSSYMTYCIQRDDRGMIKLRFLLERTRRIVPNEPRYALYSLIRLPHRSQLRKLLQRRKQIALDGNVAYQPDRQWRERVTAQSFGRELWSETKRYPAQSWAIYFSRVLKTSSNQSAAAAAAAGQVLSQATSIQFTNELEK